MAITYPLQEAHFINDLKTSVNKEFAKLKKAELPQNESAELSWNLHIESTAQMVSKLCDFLEKKGGKVKTNFSLPDFSMICGYKVVVVQAHCNKEEKTVELFDQKYSIKEVVNAIPADFSGIFDLTVCNSDYLANEIKEKFGDACFVLQNKRETTVQVRFPVWKTIFGILSLQDMNYSEADVLVRTQMIERLKKNK